MHLEEIVQHLDKHAANPVQKHIMATEIHKLDPGHPDAISAYQDMTQSAWYRQLALEQREDGSWGRFHTMDSGQKGQRFPTTEAALRRARDLGLSKGDPMIDRCIKLMQRYISGEETWPDPMEKHHDGGKSHMLSRPFLTAANLSLFDAENPMMKPLRDVCAGNLQDAFAKGQFDEEIWDRDNRQYKGTCLKAWMVYPLWLVQNVDCMSEALQRQYLKYIWNRKEGIYYVHNFAPAVKLSLEDKDFTKWLYALEALSGFSLFAEFVNDDVLPHLLGEAQRLIQGDVSLPAAEPAIGHYAQNWRAKGTRNTDMILRIARIVMKC